jgi:hypothetical protein
MLKRKARKIAKQAEGSEPVVGSRRASGVGVIRTVDGELVKIEIREASSPWFAREIPNYERTVQKLSPRSGGPYPETAASPLPQPSSVERQTVVVGFLPNLASLVKGNGEVAEPVISE